VSTQGGWPAQLGRLNLSWWRGRRATERWCDCPDGSRPGWIIYDANGYRTWCPTCRGRLS